MTAIRTLINILDRPGGRGLLSAVASWHARMVCRQDVDVFYDEVWMHRVEGLGAVVDKRRFSYYRDSPLSWKAKIEASIAATEDFWFHKYQPRPGDVIVDVGAAAGEDTRVFARAVGDSGRVIAIEAHPRTFRYLEKTCRWNGPDNATCLQYAIMDRPGSVRIEDRGRYRSNSVLPALGSGRRKTLETPAERLDVLLAELGIQKVDFLKMNIEGAERFAMDGMREALATTRNVCIACHDFKAERGEGEAFRTRDYVIERLRGHEFDLFIRQDDRRPYVRDHVHGVKRQ